MTSLHTTTHPPVPSASCSAQPSACSSLPLHRKEQGCLNSFTSGWWWSLLGKSAFWWRLLAERESGSLSGLCYSVMLVMEVKFLVPPNELQGSPSGCQPRERHGGRLQRRLCTEQLEVSVMKDSSEKSEKTEDGEGKRRKTRHNDFCILLSPLW